MRLVKSITTEEKEEQKEEEKECLRQEQPLHPRLERQLLSPSFERLLWHA
jgi:hypothetical protein